jgi:hypothetical protein
VDSVSLAVDEDEKRGDTMAPSVAQSSNAASPLRPSAGLGNVGLGQAYGGPWVLGWVGCVVLCVLVCGVRGWPNRVEERSVGSVGAGGFQIFLVLLSAD